MTTRKILLQGLLAGALWGAIMTLVWLGPSYRATIARDAIEVHAREIDPKQVAFVAVAWSIGGFVFGAGIAGFLAWLRRWERNHPIELEPGERVLRDGAANCRLKSLVTTSGWLYLTDRRLRFRAHGFNLARARIDSYPLASIVAVEPAMTFGIVANGLRVSLGSGETIPFVVNDRDAWREAIEAARGGATGLERR